MATKPGVYQVQFGDTLSEIAWNYNSTYNYGKTVNQATDKLAKINGISNPDKIYVGQEIKLTPTTTSSSGSTSSSSSNLATSPTITSFGLLNNTDRTLFATWSWNRANTASYQLRWEYDTGNGIWFVDDATATYKQAQYNAPSNAKRVRFSVKAVPRTYRDKKGNEIKYFTDAKWCTYKYYTFKAQVDPLNIPPVPQVTIDNYMLKAEVTNLDIGITAVQFEVVKDNMSIFSSGVAMVRTTRAEYSCPIQLGSQYKVRCRVMKGNQASEWSEYSGDSGTKPSGVSMITICRAKSATSVYLEWMPVGNSTAYSVQYTTDRNYFDNSSEVQSVDNIEYPHYEVTGLESGREYFFRVRATNDVGESQWSGIASVIIGKKPSAPTTWSSTTTCVVGDSLVLHWVHNSEDESPQTLAEIEVYVDHRKNVYTVNSTVEEDDKKTMSYSIDTSQYTEGVKIQWRVRTAGATREFSDWSIQRTIDIYAPPTLEMLIKDVDGDVVEQLRSFPFYISAIAGPRTQKPIGYHVSILSTEAYETVDNVGNPKNVTKGEELYSKVFDTSEDLLIEISAGNIDLENNITYKVICTVSMDSGLTTESSSTFIVAWNSEEYLPTAEVGIDKNNISAYIRPYIYIDRSNLFGFSKNTMASKFGIMDKSIKGVKIEVTEPITTQTILSRVLNIGFEGIKGDYTFSAIIHANNEFDLNIDICDTASKTFRIRPTNDLVILTASPKYYIQANGFNGFIDFESSNVPANTTIYIEDIKVERGSEYTEWTPAPEDKNYSGAMLAVYRREYDGTYTEIMSGIDSSGDTTVTDPHPALDYARYRIVATDKLTGAVSYTDLEGYPVQEKAIVIQWNENWIPFDAYEDNRALTNEPWTGSMLKLPYNIDISDKYNPDYSVVEYIGRKHPVSYYGTQLGETSSWSVDIPAYDKETLYALRRLAKWMGDVYVREPSGSGYWAKVTVSFSQKHLELTIPVNLEITRVEGGI